MKRIQQFAWRDRLPLILFTVLFLTVILTFQMLQPQFLSSANIINIAQSVSTTVIAAIGLTFVIAIGRSDISFYMSCCFCGVLMAWLVSMGWHPAFAIIAGIAAGAGWGSVSGIAVGKFKLPDIITTIAIGSIAFGLGYVFSDGAFIMTNFIEAKTHYWSQFLMLRHPASGVRDDASSSSSRTTFWNARGSAGIFTPSARRKKRRTSAAWTSTV